MIGRIVSNTKGSALRDAGCVVRVGQGVLSGASQFEHTATVVCKIQPQTGGRSRCSISPDSNTVPSAVLYTLQPQH